MSKERRKSTKIAYLRDNKTIREAIRYRMKEKGITQGDLAERVGLMPYQISLYLNDKKPSITEEFVLKLLDYLKIEIVLKVKLV
jgi:transcriptional regulator with XRE-family HTH domain